jgi:hypothetical protein
MRAHPAGGRSVVKQGRDCFLDRTHRGRLGIGDVGGSVLAHVSDCRKLPNGKGGRHPCERLRCHNESVDVSPSALTAGEDAFRATRASHRTGGRQSAHVVSSTRARCGNCAHTQPRPAEPSPLVHRHGCPKRRPTIADGCRQDGSNAWLDRRRNPSPGVPVRLRYASHRFLQRLALTLRHGSGSGVTPAPAHRSTSDASQ